MKKTEPANVTTPDDTPVAVLRPEGAATYIGVSEGKLWKLARDDPDFPTPFKLGPRITVFRVRELDRWLDIAAARNVASKVEPLRKARAQREAKRSTGDEPRNEAA
ncbi:helix-turn-helix transcriptional regulator [Paraburkholderia silvatlantica]|uniref:DNA-binding transcriptional regulator AlpA n=1 Tax=Paraburkholderia silvatlantica TaxID=321895 RepID=A0ABR6FRR9_9BURK|nr:AlpA family phage regulatory protein [Paraburkholderia silvatlantica]MBB2930140.1 putative DNA-binding transcriptional regulator AlpA [Paraburkholderia silvatlantica]PVY22481.1 AlpA family transcriptional regulator [Paraburkholderia silvatlantica]PXW28950.1 AlpA family transcriptional regulator [Paraburkholderia silvatlantica]